ncbi:MAG TPA: RHS repeat-associated core domain-containing protein, partial [Verrucomicrobiota bacterium]|nr:RHS repeat-associated core domain-containing protein [Verrucomicrobiota bacterium]
DIGNRTETKAGGDSTGGNLRTAEYGANSLNQYTNRTVPGYVDVLGIGTAAAAVTVNGTGAYRRGEYFHVALAVDNSSGPQYPSIVIQAVAGANSASSTGRVFLAKTPETFVHDADGNLTQDGRWAYTWDGENRLVTMEALSTVPAAAKLRVEFEYDWRGRRIGKTVKAWSGTSYTNVYVLKFLYDGWNLAAELDANNAVVRSYLWGTDLSGSFQGAGGVRGLLAVNVATNGVHFPAYDGNGNIAGLVSASTGAVTARFEYGPFAEPIRVSGPIARAVPLRFSTKYLDGETGLYYYGYRYYDPSMGTWLSRDPIEEQGGVNLFGFVANNPIDNYDLLGLFDTGSQGRTDAVKKRATVRADLKNMVDNMLASRDKSCTKGKAIERKRFKPASDTSYAFMYFTGYFLLGQVSVLLDGKGYYEVDCCKQKYGKWEIFIHGSFRDKFDELIPTLGIGGRKDVGSLPLTFVGEWVEYCSGSE